ncbi:MAG: ATP-binding protein [Candidatus Bathyarchaeota archaeon]|nr:ATP-binding protein [Candidatus Bathyarchaeota archaeon]
MGWIKDLWSFKKNPFSIRELSNSDELQKLFVDRKKEVKPLKNTFTGCEGGVVCGISGVRGCGKSTVLNKVLDEIKQENGLIIKVKASGTYAELDFLQKLLTDMCDQIEIQDLPEKVVEEVIRLKTNLLYTEKVAEGRGSEASIRASIKASILSFFSSEIGSEIKEKITKNVERQIKPYSKSTLSREILQFLSFLRSETKFDYIVVGIDETDKCRFDVAEKLLDSIKALLGTEHCHFVFVGTLQFHKNFAQAFKGLEEEATLASIFEDIVLITLFSNQEIVDIINKRLSYYSIGDKPKKPFSSEAMQVILELANGNPKQAMRLCSQGFMYFGDKGKEISPADLVEYFESKNYIQDLTRTEKEYVNVVKKLGEVSAISKKLFEELAKKGIKHKRKQYRVHLERLVNKRYLKKTISEKEQVVYMPSELCKHIS